jgi:drug/metabolite transporter (DMT)-like permease
MLGLSSTPAATSSLLLNLESVLTAVIAWVVFRENVDAQIFPGMVAIVAGGVLLSWYPEQAAVPMGALLIVGACLCWAIDNNLTRKVSTNDAMVIACLKGLVAGASDRENEKSGSSPSAAFADSGNACSGTVFCISPVTAPSTLRAV